jgi:hypothetical protein
MQARLGSRSQLQLLDFQLRQIFCYSSCERRKIRVIAFCNPNWSSRLCFSQISSIDAEVPSPPRWKLFLVLFLPSLARDRRGWAAFRNFRCTLLKVGAVPTSSCIGILS